MRRQQLLTIYVEGGGDDKALLRDCKKAFGVFFERAGLSARSFSVYPSGGRKAAYEDYCTALENGENALLLVDAEDPIRLGTITGKPIPPWAHLAEREGDKWTKPAGAKEEEAQLMVPVMEAWFIADRDSLAEFYTGKYNREKFKATAIPSRPDVEQLTKREINKALTDATAGNEKKGPYEKGEHSFKILETIDPAKVVEGSYHARRLLCHLHKRLKATATPKPLLNCDDFNKR